MLRRFIAGAAAAPLLAALALAGPAAPARADVNVYVTPGEHTVNGREWRTTCEEYSSAPQAIDRCRAEIWATQVVYEKGRYVRRNMWAFNNLTYLPAPAEWWGDNPLANTGTWTDASGRRWETSCGDDWTGPAACRTFTETKTVEAVADGRGGWRFVVKPGTMVFNNVIYFAQRGDIVGPTPSQPPANPWFTADPTVQHVRYSDAEAARYGITASRTYTKRDGTRVTLTKEMQYNAHLAWLTIQNADWPGISQTDKDRLAVAALLTMAQESTFYANKTTEDPDRNKDIGPFQLRCLPGWHADLDSCAANIPILQSIPYSALTFVEGHKVAKTVPGGAGKAGYVIPGMFQIKNWRTLAPWEASVKVQVPASWTYGYYANWQPVAEQLVRERIDHPLVIDWDTSPNSMPAIPKQTGPVTHDYRAVPAGETI